MITKRPRETRGFFAADWIASARTFTFESYRDWNYMNFSSLQTINDDRAQPGGHTPRHKHTNREIFGYVVKGPCRHTDDHGNVVDIPSGAVQRISAGTGLWHTEGNASDHPIRYLQLWIMSDPINTTPEYGWHQFSREDKLNQLCDITAQLPIHADARLLAGIFTCNYSHTLNSARQYYVYVVSGTGSIDGWPFQEGDGFAYTNETQLTVTPTTESELIIFDLL